MDLQLTPNQNAFVRQAIEGGRLRRGEDAVREALSLWEERERTRGEILGAADGAEASLACGEGRPITHESMQELAASAKQRDVLVWPPSRVPPADGISAHSAGDVEIADRLIDSITDRFFLLASHPHKGRARDEDLRPRLRSFPAGEYVIIYGVRDEDVLILRVLRGSRNLASLFGH